MTQTTMTTDPRPSTDTRSALPGCPPWCLAQASHLTETGDTNSHDSGALARVRLWTSGEDVEHVVDVRQDERVDWVSRQLVTQPPVVAVVRAGQRLEAALTMRVDEARALVAALQTAVDTVDGR